DVSFDVTLLFKAPGAKCTLTYRCGEARAETELAPDARSITLPKVPHRKGLADLAVTIAAEKPFGPDYVELKRSAP
ncbi:MAG TPA: hypothetical protein VKU80_09760, partial [Planctomycetota bacterium]|nr:hypothetical protein [Planctomycetota bacterium]